MILAFKKEFVQPILDDTKKHTIRFDILNRWWSGRSIHMATGVRSKNYHCFKEGQCIRTQKVEFIREAWTLYGLSIVVDGIKLDWSKHIEFANNDGFNTVQDLFAFFEFQPIKATIIHWTNLKY